MSLTLKFFNELDLISINNCNNIVKSIDLIFYHTKKAARLLRDHRQNSCGPYQYVLTYTHETKQQFFILFF